jgi:amino acid permease
MIIPPDTLIALIIVSFLGGMMVMLLLILLGLRIMDWRENAHLQLLRQADGKN